MILFFRRSPLSPRFLCTKHVPHPKLDASDCVVMFGLSCGMSPGGMSRLWWWTLASHHWISVTDREDNCILTFVCYKGEILVTRQVCLVKWPKLCTGKIGHQDANNLCDLSDSVHLCFQESATDICNFLSLFLSECNPQCKRIQNKIKESQLLIRNKNRFLWMYIKPTVFKEYH